VLFALTGGATHGCIYCGTARREKYKLAKGIWPEGGGLGAAIWWESACRSGATLERLEGKGLLLSVMFLVEFPSLEQVKAWHNDPEYAHMIHVRQTGADADIVVLTESTSTL